MLLKTRTIVSRVSLVEMCRSDTDLREGEDGHPVEVPYG